MTRREPGVAARYGLALALAAAALAGSLLAGSFVAANVFLFFFAAVVAAAWYGGRGPALLVAALAIPLVNYFLLTPRFTWDAAPADVLRLAVFAVVALLIGSMRETLGAARRAAEEHAQALSEQAVELESQAEALQGQAAELEQQTEEAQTLAEELEEANQRLRESTERQLAEAQRLAHLGSWEWEVAGDRVAWSDEMFRIYGYEPGAVELTLGSFLEAVHPEDRAWASSHLQRAMRDLQPFEFAHRIVLPDGSVRVLNARGTVEAGADGRAARMAGTGQDVTAQRDAEAAGRGLAVEQAARAEAEAAGRRLAEILEGIGDPFVAVDGDWRITFANSRAGELLGSAAAELPGRDLFAVLPDAGGEAHRALRCIGDAGAPGGFEYHSPALDAWLAVRAAPREGGLSISLRDVTARRKARAQVALLASIVESSQDAIFSKALDGTVRSWNRAAERLYGYTAAEMVGRSMLVLAPDDRPDEIPAILARIAAGERVEAYQTVRRRRDGTLVEVLLTVSPLADEEGRIVGASTIARDVTETRRGEEAVRFLAEASRALGSSLDYRATLAAVVRLAVPRMADFCAVGLLDDSGEARTVEVAHVQPELAAPLREVLRRYPPRLEGAAPISQVLTTGRSLLWEEVAPGALEASVPAPDAQAMIAALGARSLLVVPMQVEGRNLGVLGFGLSRSARRYGPADLELAEDLARRAATAVENARLHAAEQEARHEAEAAAERTSRLQAVTAALSGARTPAEVAQVVVDAGVEAVGASAAWMGGVLADDGGVEVLASRGHPAGVVEEFRRVPLDAHLPISDALRSGEVLCLESPAERARRYPELAATHPATAAAWVAVPVMVEDRAVGGLGLNFATEREFDDATRGFLLALARQAGLALERARLYEAERDARAEAEAANRAKFDFLTTMSHELRTPLNAIAGYVELLELEIRGPVNPDQREYLDKIRRSQTHLLGLINDVLNFARIETGHVHFDLRDVPLDELLAGAEAMVAPQVQARGLTYEYRRCDPRLTVRADAEKLRQVVLNLLSNAVKFTPPEGSIVLECQAADDPVQVRVRDTGLGIAGDKLATIFEPFVQVNAGYTRTAEGTGLGLSISRDLARLMGGELTVESTEGEGSVFTLTLPAGVRMAGGDESWVRSP